MDIEFNKGFTIFKNHDLERNLVFVSPHSGPAIETPTSRDDNSDTVASLCFQKNGGNLVIGNSSRKQIYGIDFNRQLPKKEDAIKNYENFLNDLSKDESYEFGKKYAFVSKNSNDYKERSKIYKNFWNNIKVLGNFYIFIHRKYNRIKNYPSIMDIASFEGKGIEKPIIEAIVKNLNKNHYEFLKKIKSNYRDAILLEERRNIERINEIFGEFSFENLKVEYKDNMNDGIKVIEKYAKKNFLSRMKKNFNEKNFIMAGRNSMNNGPEPEVTIEKIFTGKLSYGPRTELQIGNKNIVLQIELNEFLARFYPEKASEIITEIINEIKKIEKYKFIGMNQTQIKKFIELIESKNNYKDDNKNED